MYSTIINFVQNNKRIEYATSLDPFSSKDHLIRLIDGYIAEIKAFQKDEKSYVIPSILTYEPSEELAVINKIFSIIEMDKKIYPRMYIYLHINFNTIRDAFRMVNKSDEAIVLFNEFRDRVERMTIGSVLSDDLETKDDLKLILDTVNPVIGCKYVAYDDDICDFFDDYNFGMDNIIGYDNILKSCQNIRSKVDTNVVKLIDFDHTISIGGFMIVKSIMPVYNVDIVFMLIELMRSSNVTSFWMKEINDAVIKRNDYRDSWGFFGPQTPAFLKIQIPDNIRHSMYNYIRFLTEQLEEYALGYMPEVKDRKSTNYFGMSYLDEFLYEFNNGIKHLLYDVYTHAALINVVENVISKNKFNRLLELIDKVHTGMSHRHIIVKSLLYFNILIGNDRLDKLLALFELMFGGGDYNISKDEIESFIKGFKNKYYINSRYDDRDEYEKKLVSMTFCCNSVREIIDYLADKIDTAN